LECDSDLDECESPLGLARPSHESLKPIPQFHPVVPGISTRASLARIQPVLALRRRGRCPGQRAFRPHVGVGSSGPVAFAPVVSPRLPALPALRRGLYHAVVGVVLSYILALLQRILGVSSDGVSSWCVRVAPSRSVPSGFCGLRGTV
jgi:hypothetical protein